MATVSLISPTNDSANSSAAFNPFLDVYAAQSERPPELEDIDPKDLTPYERGCLMIDGTVTRYLEAQMLEPVAVVECGQTVERLRRDHRWLDLPKGSRVIARRVLLTGKKTGRVHASAATLLIEDRLQEVMGGGAIDEIMSQGIGRMLLKGRIEQFRELLWYGKEPPLDLPGEMRTLASEYALTRTYRIIANRRPLMMITEWFELGTGVAR
jgi:chorismate-pyruvate lyase